ncbi:MAG: tetratricopeptide repeat protein [Rhodocyclaceae bacterium]|nr:tetratricopeptide repeat protein [Rhodocyclaceae bacterium]
MASAWLLLASASGWAQSLEEINQLIKAGQHGKALELANRYLADKPKDAQGRFLKGIALTGLNKQNEAIAVFQKLTEDYPHLPEPYNNLAVIYAQQKQYDKAREALEKAIRTHPAYATAHENLGDIYSRLASEAYGKALSLDASNASAQIKLAMIDSLVSAGKATPASAVATSSAKPTPAPLAKADLPAEPPKPAVLTKPAETKEVKEAKPAPEAKAPEPRPAPPPAVPADDVHAEITATVDRWLAAWSRKDVKAYLAHYAKDFQVPGGQSRKAWEAERAQRVGKPGKIEVTRDKLAIKVEGNQAIVRFRQSYKSAGFNATSGKTLVMSRENGKWLIREERVGG